VTVVGLMGAIAAQESWIEGALCAQVDPERFFPDAGASTREAKAVCRACPVQAACLRYALERNEQHGVWGGATHRERREMRLRPTVPRTACNRGHEYETFGRRADGSCPECRRIQQRRNWSKRIAHARAATGS
jgi:WhiB family redox-sensing transcriptional regulator